jgi:hypothetical protein
LHQDGGINLRPKPEKVLRFFSSSEHLDYLVLRPLSHIAPYWELTWDHSAKRYVVEDDSFAELLNSLVQDLSRSILPSQHHKSEDILAQYVIEHLKWPIRKENGRWVGVDYDSILEQGGFHDVDQQQLLLAAAGRIRAAIKLGQLHFDNMEESHQRMLATVLSIILYHRYNYNG